MLGAVVRIGACAGGDDPDAVLVALHLLSNGSACALSTAAVAARNRRYTGDPVKWAPFVGVVVDHVRSRKSSSASLAPSRKTNRCRSEQRSSEV